MASRRLLDGTWSCRIKLPPTTSKPPSPRPKNVDKSQMATADEDGLAPGEQALSMVEKLQNGIEGDLDGHQDPDAQACVTDFLDFTEYLPSDMTRSLTLIGNLNQTYVNASKNVHDLTKKYGEMPSLPSSERKDATELRGQVSMNLSEALQARTLSYEEACRLKDNVDRHYNRLKNIHAKLQKMADNYPPSRAASAEPQKSKSPQAVRAAPKVTLRLDGSKTGERVRKHRTPRITVPGEVMAPFELDYDSYGSYTDSDLSDDDDGPSRNQTPAATSSKPKSIKLNVAPKPQKEKIPKANRPPKPDGPVGTNVHSQVAGISTSNALAKLKPPPSDVRPGDPDAPWLKLTAWELAKLRKKMKKNAVWNPSDTMIARELQSKGRAIEDYNRHNEERKKNGLPPLDLLPQMMNAASAKRVLEEGEISAEAWRKGEMSNRGMKLNEAKKLKKENEKKAAAEEANKLNEVAAQDSTGHKDSTKNAKDASATELAVEDNAASKDTPAKPVKPTPSKSKSSKKGASKEVKDEASAAETPTEHTHLLSSLEGIKERIKGLASAPPISTGEKSGESANLKKQPAKPSKKRKTRDSTADTETSKASKASKIEGPVPGSSLRVERRSATETPVPTPQSLSTTTTIPLAPPGPASTRANARRGTPATVESAGPTSVPDQAPEPTEKSSGPADSKTGAGAANLPEGQVAGDLANEAHQVEQEVAKTPAKKKETVREKREREKKEKEAKKAATPGVPNRRKTSVASIATPVPEPPALPTRRNPSRPSSRNGKAPSNEPQPSSAKDRPRRSSTANNTPAPETRAPSKRLEAKRPPPGQVTAGPEGSASVSISKRKAAPKKRAAPKKQKEEGKELFAEDMVEFDDEGNIIDADEPRYCICNKVSYGNMIACDSDKKLGRACPYGEWFHYDCMGFSETNMPSRRNSWYCADCMKEINSVKGGNEKTNKRR